MRLETGDVPDLGLAGAVGGDAEAVADALLSASQRFAPGAPIDDTALLVLRVTAT